MNVFRLRVLLRVYLPVLLTGLGIVGLPGCGDDTDLPAADFGDSPNQGPVEVTPCNDGTTRECGEEIARRGNVVTCFQGTQICEDSVWGPCTDGEAKLFRIPPKSEAGVRTRALSPPENCDTPCDPLCQEFDEIPMTALETTVSVNFAPWEQGIYPDLPGSLQYNTEPCLIGSDCEFNTSCNDVDTAFQCQHSKCEVGFGLSCQADDPCVNAICNTPGLENCCSFGAASCAHAPCTQGRPLHPDCSQCANDVCEVDPYCCAAAWDAACVTLAGTTGSCSCPVVEEPDLGGFVIAHWSFDTADITTDGSGKVTSAVDSTGAHHATGVHDGTGTSASVAGQFGQALQLNNATGSGQVNRAYMTFPQLTELMGTSGASYTISAWVQLTDVNNNAILADWGTSASGNRYPYWFAINGRRQRGQSRYGTGNGTDIFAIQVANDAANYVNDGTWHHVAWTFNKSSGQLVTYRDGVAINTSTAGGASYHMMVGSSAVGTIGRKSDNNDMFVGAIDELWVLPSVVSATEIVTLRDTNEPPTCNGPNDVLGTNGSCYRFVATTVNYYTARDACEAMGTGWYLATISDATENAWVENEVNTRLATEAWIGLNDAVTNGVYEWESGETPGYYNWGSGEPSSSGPGSAPYACFRMVSGGGWADAGCTGNNEAYVCEKANAAVATSSECGVGEAVGPEGHCYYLDSTSRTWSAARTACQARSPAGEWDLISIDEELEDEFAYSLITNNTWIGFNDIATEGSFVWSDGTPTGFVDWDSGQPNAAGDCVYLKSGDALSEWVDADCSGTRPSLCERALPPAPAPPDNWDANCVAAVESVCHARCGTPPAAGNCSPYLVGAENPDCALGDLGAAVACQSTATGGPVVPVCNHGTQPIAVDAVYTYAAASGYWGQCDPPTAAAIECAQANGQSIDPGECISIECPEIDGLDREIYVSTLDDECDSTFSGACLDNWTAFSPMVACGIPACSGVAVQANVTQVNLFIMLDRSGSMGTLNRWAGASSALNAFFQDAGSAGLNVALEMFDVQGGAFANDASGNGCGDRSSNACSVSDCTEPFVPLGQLQAAAGDAQENALLAAVAISHSGNTPSPPALEGALQNFRAEAQANPDDIWAVVFITDGEPTRCMNGLSTRETNARFADLARDAYVQDGVLTYTVALFGANAGAQDMIARAGGTNEAFVIGNGNQTEIAAELLTAMQDIAGSSQQCSFSLPNPGSFDPNNAEVSFTDGGNVTTELTEQTDVTACGDGWYFEPDATNPMDVTLCPTTCSAVTSDPDGRIDITLACPDVLGPQTYSEIYEMTCEPDQIGEWRLLTWEATTPLDSRIVFRARTADAQADLAAAAWHDLGTASTALGTETCAASGPAPDCPVQLDLALSGLPDMAGTFLALEATIYPDSSGEQSAVLTSWNLKHTCLFAQ